MKHLLWIFCWCVASPLLAQNDDPAGSITLPATAMSAYTSLAASGCGSTIYNLGSTTSSATPAATSGTMANDVWFQFTAVAEVAKIKVCSPTTFDAAIEVWNSGVTGSPLGASNVGGSGAKEYLCVSGLTVGSNYKVRVGRVSGTGAGTFSILYEHLGVEVRNGYFPDPPGTPTCYDFTSSIQRTFLTYSTSSTRWKFIDPSGNVLGPFTSTYVLSMSAVTGLCEGVSYQVLVEVQATDAECGSQWWGYSTPRTIVFCSDLCPTLSINNGVVSCGTTYCNIFNTDFSCSYLGAGVEYQFRFVTDNGATDFCTAWSTSPVFSSATIPYSNYFRYNKIYQVYYRARKCNTNPNWCGPCVVSTCGLPYVSVNPASCCIWRNKGNGGTINATPIAGMDQYRFRFTPVDPCSTTPYLPTGPAISTNWNSSIAVNPTNVAVTTGQVYMVQVQCRVLSTTAISCTGSNISLPSQQSDWGPPCFIGFRVSTSPPVGTALTCCSYGMIALEELNELLRDETEMNQEFIPFEGQAKPTTSLHVQRMQANHLVVNWDGQYFQQAGSIGITDMMGRELMRQDLPALMEQSQLELSWSESLASGIYLIRITDGIHTLTRKVLVHAN